MPRLLVIFCLVVTLAVPGRITAQAADPNAEAAALAEEASAAYDAGDLEGALVLFEQALSWVPDPAFAFNIAYINEELDALYEAWRYYGQYLDLYPGAPNRDEVEAKQSELRARFESEYAEIRIATSPEGAVVTVRAGGREPSYGEAPVVVWVAPGPIVLRAELEGFLTTERTLNAVAGVRLPIEIALAPILVDIEPSPYRPWAIATLAAGMGTFAVGVVLWISAENTASSYNEAVAGIGADPDPPSTQGLLDERDRAERQARVGNILVGVGSALLAGGAVLAVLWSNDSQGSDLASEGEPRGRSWTLLPAGLGLELSGRF